MSLIIGKELLRVVDVMQTERQAFERFHQETRSPPLSIITQKLKLILTSQYPQPRKLNLPNTRTRKQKKIAQTNAASKQQHQ